LSSKIKKDLALIYDLIYKAKFKQAEEMIEKIIADKKTSEEHRLEALGYKVELYAFLGETTKSIEIADEILSTNKEKVTVPKLQAVNGKAYAHCLKANLSECKQNIQESEQLLTEAKEIIPQEDYDRNMMFLYFTKANLAYFTGDIPNTKKYAEELITSAKKCKNDFFIFSGFATLSSYYHRINDRQKTFEIFTKKMAPLVESSDNEYMKITHEFIILSYTPSKSLEEVKIKIRKMEELIVAFETLGTKAYYHKSFNLYEISFGKTTYLHNVAWQYVIKRDYETAMGYYLQLLDYSQEIKSAYWLIYALINLIDVTLELGKIDQAKEYLVELKPLVDTFGQEFAVNYYMIYQAKILSTSTKIKDWVKAQELFEKVLTKELTDSQKIAVYFSSSELLIIELQMTGDEETLNKLKENVKAMKNISKVSVYTQLSINLLRLESKLALLEYQEEKAIELLQEAITQAEQYNLPKFIAEIKTEQQTLEDQKDLWQESKKKEEPLKERLEHVAISKSMKEMKEKTIGFITIRKIQ